MNYSRLAAAVATGCAVAVLAVGGTSADPIQKKKAAKPAAAAGGDVAAGKKAYQANGCKACHVIGDDKGGKTGPDLTHVGKTRKPDWLAAQIRNPKKFDPKSAMPAYGADKIDDKALKSLAAYMAGLK